MIGEYATSNGGVFTVTEILSPTRFKGYCSVCSKDAELFPDPFTVTKESLLIKKPMCGCHKSYSYSYDQYVILCLRKSSSNIEYLSMAAGVVADNITSSSKVVLRCNKHNVVWDSRTIYNFLYKETHCTNCLMDTKDDEQLRSWVGSVRYYNGALQEIVAIDGKCLTFTCSKCITDRELYPVNFTILKGDWNNGGSSCGCSKSYRWSGWQYEMLCKRAVSKRNDCTFIRIIPNDYGNVRCNSKVELSCNTHQSHGTWTTTSIEKFLSRGASCPECVRLSNSYGLYKDRLDENDILYLLRFGSKSGNEPDFIKIGRSFNLQERLRPFNRKYNVSEITLIEDKHLLVYIRESSLHKNLNEFSYSPLMHFGGCINECYTTEVLNQELVIKTFNL